MTTLLLMLALGAPPQPAACAFDKMPRGLFRLVAAEFVACIRAREGRKGRYCLSPETQKRIAPYCGPKVDA